jgi:hypothetical protein
MGDLSIEEALWQEGINEVLDENPLRQRVASLLRESNADLSLTELLATLADDSPKGEEAVRATVTAMLAETRIKMTATRRLEWNAEIPVQEVGADYEPSAKDLPEPIRRRVAAAGL